MTAQRDFSANFSQRAPGPTARQSLTGRFRQRGSSQRRGSKQRRLLLCEQLEVRRVLTSYLVDTVADVVAEDGMVSLREALMAANSNLAVNEAQAGQSAEQAIDTIAFAGELGDARIELSLGELSISESVNLRAGRASSVVIDAAAGSRVLNVAAGSGTVILDSLTLSGGLDEIGGGIWVGAGTLLRMQDVQLIDNVATGDDASQGGGGLYSDQADVVMTGGAIRGNLANGASGSGGGVFNAGGNLSLRQVTVAENVANRAGGGIEQSGDEAESLFSEVMLVDNIAGPDGAAAPGNGGGLHVSGGGDVDLSDSVVSNNSAAREGGGLWNGLGTMTIHDSTVSGNVASGNAADDGGGGIFNNGGTLKLFGGELVGNVANGDAGSGGGLFSTAGLVVADRTQIQSNVANRAGGGIEIVRGDLTLTDVMLGGAAEGMGNVAGPDGSAAPGNGGGLHVTGDAGQTVTRIVITGGVVQGNVAASEGGGLWNQSGAQLSVSGQTEIIGNRALGESNTEGGGGVFNNGGVLSLVDVTVRDNAATGAAGGGGGIANDGGSVSIVDSVITGNVADGSSGSGGGLLSLGGSVDITASSFEFNGANRAGGAIEVVDGVVTLTDSHLINNDVDGTATGGVAAPGNGGGLHVTGIAQVNLIGGTVFGNVAASEGGGLWNQAGSTMTVDGTLIEANTALGDQSDNGGGGIFNNGGVLDVINADIVSNYADGASGSGGGVLNVAGGVVTISDT
ncbi:hypothetical protein NHH03_27745, partial [Stieleria sp. TO1_6]|nr:hypothetical protein [Stieleria tagensis]